MQDENSPINRPTLQAIQQLIGQKYWYSATPEGGFNWDQSTRNVAEALQRQYGWGNHQQIKDAFESAFSPDSLTMVEDDHPAPFIEKVTSLAKDHGGETFLWTVGDYEWQKTKYTRSGVDTWIDQDHFTCASTNKHEGLRTIFQKIRATYGENEPIDVYIVDDKSANLAQAMQLTQEAQKLGIMLHNYHVKLYDPQADPTACYNYLKEKVKTHTQSGRRVIIILDQDGVITDTDRTNFEIASRNILKTYGRTAFSEQ